MSEARQAKALEGILAQLTFVVAELRRQNENTEQMLSYAANKIETVLEGVVEPVVAEHEPIFSQYENGNDGLCILCNKDHMQKKQPVEEHTGVITIDFRTDATREQLDKLVGGKVTYISHAPDGSLQMQFEVKDSEKEPQSTSSNLGLAEFMKHSNKPFDIRVYNMYRQGGALSFQGTTRTMAYGVTDLKRITGTIEDVS